LSATEKLAVGALFSALLLIAPGYILHQAPRFPGSLPGSLLGFAAALLFVLLLAAAGVFEPVWRADFKSAFTSSSLRIECQPRTPRFLAI